MVAKKSLVFAPKFNYFSLFNGVIDCCIYLTFNHLCRLLTNPRFNRKIDSMFARHISSHILKYAEQYPVVALVGPRQSGKTTLVKTLFSTYKYLSLENLTIRKNAVEDPEGFLATHGPYLILDEV